MALPTLLKADPVMFMPQPRRQVRCLQTQGGPLISLPSLTTTHEALTSDAGNSNALSTTGNGEQGIQMEVRFKFSINTGATVLPTQTRFLCVPLDLRCEDAAPVVEELSKSWRQVLEKVFSDLELLLVENPSE